MSNSYKVMNGRAFHWQCAGWPYVCFPTPKKVLLSDEVESQSRPVLLLLSAATSAGVCILRSYRAGAHVIP